MRHSDALYRLESILAVEFSDYYEVLHEYYEYYYIVLMSPSSIM